MRGMDIFHFFAGVNLSGPARQEIEKQNNKNELQKPNTLRLTVMIGREHVMLPVLVQKSNMYIQH